MSIETTHNEKTLRYNETNDEWDCPAYDLTAKTLSALKTKVNDFDAKERKLGKNGVILLKVDGYRFRSSKELAPKVRATMLDKGIEENATHAAVWISHISDSQREKVGINCLILDTEENLATLAEAKRLEDEGQALVIKGQKVRAEIKRVTVDEIKAMALEVKP